MKSFRKKTITIVMLVATVASYALGMSVFQNVIPARRTAQLKGLTGVNNNQRLANARQNSLNRNGASSNISNARKALKDEKPELIIDTDSICDIPLESSLLVHPPMCQQSWYQRYSGRWYRCIPHYT